MPKAREIYSPEFKQEAIQLSETAGYEPCTLVQVFQSTRLRGGC